MIVTVTNSKGGVGKTTSTLYLAALAADRGLDVVVVDADQQGSAAEYLERAPIPLVEIIEVTPRQLEKVLGEPHSKSREAFVIVDTPPGDTQPSVKRPACELAQFIVIPTRPGGLEPSRVETTIAELPAKTPRGLVLVGTRATNVSAATLAYWQAAEVAPIIAQIPERTSIQVGPLSPRLSREGLDAYSPALDAILAVVK